MKRLLKIKKVKVPQQIENTGFVKERKYSESQSSFEESRRYLAWAKVTARHSEDITVDVLLDSGIDVKRVSVRSAEWSGSTGSVGYGERDLPPVDSLVLVVFPYGSIEEGIVLCSAFSAFGKHTNAWKSDLMSSNKESERKVIKESGLTIVEDKSNGSITLTLPSSATLTLNASGAISLSNSGAAVTLTANGATIVINSDGSISVTPATGKSLILNNGTQGANDYPNCLFTTAPHCLDVLQTVKVP